MQTISKEKDTVELIIDDLITDYNKAIDVCRDNPEQIGTHSTVCDIMSIVKKYNDDEIPVPLWVKICGCRSTANIIFSYLLFFYRHQKIPKIRDNDFQKFYDKVFNYDDNTDLMYIFGIGLPRSLTPFTVVDDEKETGIYSLTHNGLMQIDIDSVPTGQIFIFQILIMSEEAGNRYSPQHTFVVLKTGVSECKIISSWASTHDTGTPLTSIDSNFYDVLHLLSSSELKKIHTEGSDSARKFSEFFGEGNKLPNEDSIVIFISDEYFSLGGGVKEKEK